MALTRTTFGQGVMNLQKIEQYVSDDTDCKTVRLEIQTTGGSVLFSFENEPEIGTDDTFRFEVNTALASLFTADFPEIEDFADADNNTHRFINPLITNARELDADGEQLSAGSDLSDFMPVNLFRGQNLNDFNPDNTGSTDRRFFTNAPNFRPIKRGDFFWLFSGVASYTGQQLASLQEWVIQTLDADNDVIATTTIDYSNARSTAFGVFGLTGIPVQMPTSLTVVALNIFVRDKASPFTQRSEFKRYNVYEGCNDVKLWFLNQYNVPELVYMKGNVQRQILNNPSRYEQFEPVNANYNQGGIKPFMNEFRYEFTLNTGRVKPVEVQYLAEMLYSNRIAIEYEGRLFEVVLQDTDLRDFDAKDSVDNITFNFIENRTNKIV